MVKIQLNEISLNKIIKVIEGKDDSIPRTKAIYLLSKFDYPEKENYLRTILDDETDQEDARIMAIITLSNIPTEKSKEILTQSLYFKNITDKKNLLENILKGLAKIGDRKSLDAIQSLNITDNISKLVVFASNIISYRHGLAGNNFTVLSNIHNRVNLEKELNISKIDAVENIFPLDTQYDLTLNKEIGYRIIFGNYIEDRIILFNNDFFHECAILKKGIIGLVVTKPKEYYPYEVEYLITGTPSLIEDKKDIIIVRVDGKIHYRGYYQIINSDEVEFSINSLEEKDVVPLTIEGKMKKGELVIIKSGYSLK